MVMMKSAHPLSAATLSASVAAGWDACGDAEDDDDDG